jgi:hypothetical protein
LHERRTVLASVKDEPPAARCAVLDLRCAPCTARAYGRDERTVSGRTKELTWNYDPLQAGCSPPTSRAACRALWYHRAMAKETTLKELGEMLSHVVAHMATKSDIDAINETLAEHGKVLAEHTKLLIDHTRDLNIIKRDVERNLDKRLQLEVRTINLEKKVFSASQEPAHS